MKIIESYTKGRTTYELIELSSFDYCVRRTIEGIFYGETINFMEFDRNGLYISLSREVGSSNLGSKDRAYLIFNANCLALGKKIW